jgi:hypothetical protein
MMREQLLFHRVINWPADGNTYYSQQLQTSRSCEILRLHPRSSTYTDSAHFLKQINKITTVTDL